jgi:Ser/Thr protein kinase RdoA (MazF antagonist)
MALLEISDSLLPSVLSQYPLPNARVLNVLEASKRNDNLLIEDKSGHRYVLRHYRRNNQEARVRFQLHFQQHLESSGFPTSKIIRTISDDVLVVKEGAPWALFTFVEGTEYDFSREKQVVEAARRLTQFHTVTDSFQHQEVTVNISQMPDWWTDAERELHMLEKFFLGMGVDKELACIREYVSELTHEWPRERNADLQSAWVHSDYHGRNMVFVGDEMRGLFDFDVIHRGFRVEDISLAIFYFGRQDRASKIIRTEAAQAFLEEYIRNTELLPEELEALPVFAVVNCIPSAPYFDMLQRDGEDPIPYLRRYVEIMPAIRSQMKRLEPIFRGYSV